MNKVHNPQLQLVWYSTTNDVNGNPRYVTHYLSALTEKEMQTYSKCNYDAAIKRANKVGGKKYHNKKFGGGLIFQSYNLESTERALLEAVKYDEYMQKIAHVTDKKQYKELKRLIDTKQQVNIDLALSIASGIE